MGLHSSKQATKQSRGGVGTPFLTPRHSTPGVIFQIRGYFFVNMSNIYLSIENHHKGKTEVPRSKRRSALMGVLFGSIFHAAKAAKAIIAVIAIWHDSTSKATWGPLAGFHFADHMIKT